MKSDRTTHVEWVHSDVLALKHMYDGRQVHTRTFTFDDRKHTDF